MNIKEIKPGSRFTHVSNREYLVLEVSYNCFGVQETLTSKIHHWNRELMVHMLFRVKQIQEPLFNAESVELIESTGWCEGRR